MTNPDALVQTFVKHQYQTYYITYNIVTSANTLSSCDNTIRTNLNSDNT